MTLKADWYQPLESDYVGEDGDLRGAIGIIVESHTDAALALELFNQAQAGFWPSKSGRQWSDLSCVEMRASTTMAELFSHSVHRIVATVATIDRERPGLIKLEAAAVASAFDGLSGMRNAHEHVDERAFGIGPHGKPLKHIQHHRGVLSGQSDFSTTGADGKTVLIHVTRETLERLRGLLTPILATLTASATKAT